MKMNKILKVSYSQKKEINKITKIGQCKVHLKIIII